MIRWAKNPRVVEIMKGVKKLLDEGRVSEEEAFWRLNAYFNCPNNEEAYEEFKNKYNRAIYVDTESLVSALNEQLEERRQGNEYYRCEDYNSAMYHYDRVYTHTFSFFVFFFCKLSCWHYSSKGCLQS